MKQIKKLMFVVTAVLFLLSSVHCNRVDQATEALDKAKALKQQLEEKAKAGFKNEGSEKVGEVEEKALNGEPQKSDDLFDKGTGRKNESDHNED
jgi:hypothetical protein